MLHDKGSLIIFVEKNKYQGISTLILFDCLGYVQFSSVTQSCLTLCDPWNAACQASLSITNSQSLLKIMSTGSVMPSNCLILCHPLLLLPSIFPRIRSFQMSQFFTLGGQILEFQLQNPVLPMNIQERFPLGFTGWISL